jgi:hypothetical protein
MNKSAAFYSAVLVALAPLPHARAEVVFTFDPNANRVIDGQFARYTLSFTSTIPGGLITSFEGNFPDNVAFKGPLEPMPCPVCGTITTPTMDFNAVIDESKDSQFLVFSSEILSTVAPFETGNTMGGAFILGVPARAQTKPLVQIVAKKDALIEYDFSVSDPENLARFQGVLGVPEPSSLALAAFTLLSFSAARRRNIVTQRLNVG